MLAYPSEILPLRGNRSESLEPVQHTLCKSQQVEPSRFGACSKASRADLLLFNLLVRGVRDHVVRLLHVWRGISTFFMPLAAGCVKELAPQSECSDFTFEFGENAGRRCSKTKTTGDNKKRQ